MSSLRAARNPFAALLLGLLLLLPGCGGSSDGGLFDGLSVPSFWAHDFSSGGYYRTSVREAGVGLHCRIFIETGHTLSQDAIDNIIIQFDNVIYPSVTGAFGDPPVPGVDADPRITLFFLDIRDTVGADGGVVTGYFSTVNEFTQDDLASAGFPDKSNQREMIYLNVGFPAPNSAKSFRVIAHELQHMVHWEQKTHRLSASSVLGGVSDNTWLNEAMSESAPLYCGYGPDNERVDYFAANPATSLTNWNGDLASYAAAYMWSQYVFDRYPRTLFRDVLLDNAIGATSVDDVLGRLPLPKTFADLFFDWTMANVVATDNALRDVVGLDNAWHYVTPLSLASIFTTNTDRVNPISTAPLAQWTGDYYKFERTAAPFTGTVTWTAGSGQDSASFFSAGDNTVVASLSSGSAYPYTNTGYLVVRNLSGIDNATTDPGTVTVAPSVILGALMQRSPGAASPRATASGEPHMKCGLDRLERREREIRARGVRVRF